MCPLRFQERAFPVPRAARFATAASPSDTFLSFIRLFRLDSIPHFVPIPFQRCHTLSFPRLSLLPVSGPAPTPTRVLRRALAVFRCRSL